MKSVHSLRAHQRGGRLVRASLFTLLRWPKQSFSIAADRCFASCSIQSAQFFHTSSPMWCASLPPSSTDQTPTTTSSSSSFTSCEALRCAVAACRQVRDTLVDDRRVLYRDQELLAAIAPHREVIKVQLLRLLDSGAREEAWSNPSLTLTRVKELRTRWTGTLASTGRHPHLFYTTLLSSSLVLSDADIRLVLAALSDWEHTTPDPEVFAAILDALPAVCTTTQSDGSVVKDEKNTADTELVLGQTRVISRATLGDLAGYYMGLALKQAKAKQQQRQQQGGSLAQRSAEAMRDYDGLWGSFFNVCAVAQVAPKLMDLWWNKFTSFYAATRNSETGEPVTTPLPFTGVHAAVAWSASARDIERTMRFFQEANRRGLVLSHAETEADNTAEEHEDVNEFFMTPGSLTRRSACAAVQLAQLRMLAKLMETGKTVKLDGGLRTLVVRDLQQLIDPAVLQQVVSWGVVSDILGGLSMPSAMQLVKECSHARTGGDEGVPFFVWASLLRRCAHEHHQDEATALFLFIRKRFAVSPTQKRELVEIMLRMHTAMGDFPSAMDTFLTHVIEAPKGEPAVQPDVTLYNLLIKAADSRNTAMMVFLEACAAGVGMDMSTFENLLASSPYQSVASLSRKLPYDYLSSSLDSQLRIPSDADAHVRREEAITARGKPLVDSTGEFG